jgi:autotransporter-associated beta strand protein
LAVVVAIVLPAASDVSQASIEYALDHGTGNCDFISGDSQDLVNLNVYTTDPSNSYIDQLKVVYAGIPAGTAVRVLLLSIDNAATMTSGATPNYFHVLAEVDTTVLGSQRNPENDLYNLNIPAPVWSTYTLPTATQVTTSRFAIATIAYNNWTLTQCGNVMSDSDPVASPDLSWVGSAVDLNSDLSNINGNFRDLTLHTPVSYAIPNMFRAEATAAAGVTYTYGVGTNTWALAANWNPNTGIPGANDTAIFSIGGTSPRTVSLGGSQSIFALNLISTTPWTFDNGGSTNTLTLGGGGLNVTNPGTHVFNCILAGTTTITVNPVAITADNNKNLWNSIVDLANANNTFAGPIDVLGGAIQYYTDTSLGNASNAITLGSQGVIGTFNPNSSPDNGGSSGLQTNGQYTTRNITLAGMGGQIIPTSSDVFYYQGVLSGTGELILGGNNANRVSMSSATDSTYTGGTRIWNGWTYIGSLFDNNGIYDTTSADVLGTGPTRIEFGGLALVNRATNLGIGTFGGVANNPSIFVGGYNRNLNTATSASVQSLLNDSNVGVKSYLCVGANFTAVPNITSDSDGVFGIEGTSNATIIAMLAVGAPQLGNGMMTYGCRIGGTFTGSSLMADLDNVYRFSGWNGFSINTNVLNDNDVNHSYGVDVSNGLLLFVNSKNNTFSGNLTIEANGFLWLNSGGTTNAAQTPLGAASGNIILSTGGELKVGGYAGANQKPIVKNDLSFNGAGAVCIDSAGSPDALQLTTLTRNDRSTLYVEGQANPTEMFGNSTGAYAQITVANNAPASDGFMVSPVYTANERMNPAGTYAASYYMFVNYGATGTTGFSYAPFTVAGSITGGSATNGIVASQADFTGIASTDIAGVITSVATASGGTTVKALMTTAAITGTGALTVTSGGIINDNGAAITYTCPINFGSAEGMVYVRNTGGAGTVNFNSTVTGSNGLTKSGPGTLNLHADSSTTLFGQITVDQGTIAYYNSYGLGDTDKCLGDPGNSILLDGGTLLFNANFAISRAITIGPAGGTFSNGGSGSMTLSGLISGPGTFTISSTNTHLSNPNNSYAGGTLVTGGADVQVNGGLSTGPVTINGGTVTLDGTSYGQRFTLLGNGTPTLCPNNTTVSIGSLEGEGNAKVALNAESNDAYATTLTIGSDNTSTEFCGTIMNFRSDGDANHVHGSIAKTGTGTLTLSGYNIYTGTTTVNQGELDINGTLANTGQTPVVSMVTVNSGATLGGAGGVIGRDVTVNGGTLKGSLTITGNGASGDNTLTVNNGTVNLANSEIDHGVSIGGGAVTLTDSAVTGSFSIGSGGTYTGASVLHAGTTLTGAISSSSPDGLEMDAGGTFGGTNSVVEGYVYLAGGAFVGTGATSVYSPVVWLDSGSMSGSCNVTIDPNANDGPYGYAIGFYLNPFGDSTTPAASFNGSINGSVYVWGGSLSGTHTIVGDVQVGDYNGDGSHPVFSGTSNITGNVTVGLHGTFNGNHTINGSFTTTAGSNAVVAPHNGATAGTLTINGTVTLDHSTTLNFNLGAPGTTGSNDNDLISITGPLSLDGTLNVNALSGFGVGTYTLIDYTGALSGAGLSLNTAPGGFNYAINTGTPDEINLVVSNQYAAGDTNHDGLLNSLDIDAIYQNLTVAPASYIGTWPRPVQPYQAQYDVNGDGAVTQADVTYELNHYFHTSYGDSNLDRATDFGDFQTLLNHWQASGPTIGWAQADFNGDGVVDFLDFQILLNYWNPGGWNYAPSQTPEPASLTLILLGGLALLRRSRKA